MAKPALLVGAGFSANFNYPTTIQLREILVNSLEEENENFENTKKFVLDLLDHDELKDIEQILQVIDEGLFNLVFDDSKFIHKIIDKDYFKELHFGNGFYNDLINRLTTANEKISNIVYENYLPNENKKQQLFDDFFKILTKEIFGKDHFITIFTLNYDCLIEEFIDRQKTPRYILFDGFPNSFGIQEPFENYFSSTKVVNSKRSINLYKLHGSINWFKKDNVICKNKINQLYPSIPFILNPTLFRKNIESTPFKELFEQFDNQLIDTNVLVIIGYSFRDSHVNSRILKFLSSKKIIINISNRRRNVIQNQLIEFNDLDEESVIKIIEEIREIGGWDRLFCIETHIGTDDEYFWSALEEALEKENP